MREQLCMPRELPLIVLTSVTAPLADDLRARLFKRQLLEVRTWDVLRERFGARSVETRLQRDTVLGEALIECLGAERIAPPVPGGVLYEDAAWEFLLRELLGLQGARPEPSDLLKWVADPVSADRFSQLSPKLRERVTAWLVRQRGALAEALVGCLEAGSGADAFAAGLAFASLIDESVPGAERAEQQRALGRMDTFTGQKPIPVEAARAWSEAAAELARRLVKEDDGVTVRNAADRADRILESKLASPFARLSRWSPEGGRQLLDDLGRAMLKLPADTAPLEAALAGLKTRHWFEPDRPVLDRVAMALRLLRWLREKPVADRWYSCADAAHWYAAEGSWVDWARQKIRASYAAPVLTAAFQRIAEEVQKRRETENLAFGKLLAEWTHDDSRHDHLIGVERVIECYVGALDLAKTPLLIVVMDGMSMAVSRELERDLALTRWIARSTSDGELWPAVSVLPSLTRYSRYSLLAGKIGEGMAAAESRDFKIHPAFSKAGGEPVLFHFHKDALGPLTGSSSNAVVQEIANQSRRVAGVVVNAVDDDLAGSDQVNRISSLEYLDTLRLILAEAATARRVVLLTSDHGHVLDGGTEYRTNGKGDRSRIGDPQGAGEVRIEGPRVVGGPVIALSVEGVRYAQKPKSGYHGGLTPQECLVPVYVLAQPGVELLDWKEVPVTQPAWWEASATPAVAPAKSARGSGKTKQPTLFTQEADWVDQLLASDVFKQQMERAGRGVQVERIVQILRALDTAGGRLLKPAFAQRMGVPLIRVDTIVAALVGVLNVEGYPVINVDQTSQTIALDRDLLMRQFQL
jgi:PglZ domain